MIKIDKVEYGIAPYGPDQGMRCFVIRFVDDGTGDMNIKDLDPVKDSEKIGDIFYKKAQDLKQQLDEGIKASGHDDDWLCTLTQPKPNEYIYFSGRVLTDDEYFYPFNMFEQIVSVEARDMQKMIHEQGKKIELCAPKFALIVLPNSPYIKKNIYEASNLIVAPLKTELDGETLDLFNKDKFFHINGLSNIAHHPFGSYVFRINSQKDIDLFNEYYEKALLFKGRGSIRVIPGNDEMRDAAMKFAYEKKFRFSDELKGDLVLDFEIN